MGRRAHPKTAEAMGRPMARNSLKAGHTLTVYDLDPAATAPLQALGATRAGDLPSLAGEVRVTLTTTVFAPLSLTTVP